MAGNLLRLPRTSAVRAYGLQHFSQDSRSIKLAALPSQVAIFRPQRSNALDVFEGVVKGDQLNLLPMAAWCPTV